MAPTRALVWQDRSLRWGFAVLDSQGQVSRIKDGFLSPVSAQFTLGRRRVEVIPYGPDTWDRCDAFTVRCSPTPEVTRLVLQRARSADNMRQRQWAVGMKVSVSYCPDLDDRDTVYLEHGLEVGRSDDGEWVASREGFAIVLILGDGEPNPYVSSVETADPE